MQAKPISKKARTIKKLKGNVQTNLILGTFNASTI